MRKLIVSMNLTADGYMSGLHCELDWHFRCWTADMADAWCRQLAAADTILLGRTTYTAMAGYWGARAMDHSCSREDLVFVEMMNRYTKMVVSNTLTAAPWNNTILINGNPVEALRQLKQQAGKDIIIYGSGRLLSTLIPAGIIDEYQLWLHPVVLGAGRRLFGDLLKAELLNLTHMETFSSGVVAFFYQCGREKRT